MNWKDDSKFPERLRQLREKAGLLQSEFAERLGVARSSISLYETGDRVPDIRFMDKVIEEFECSYDYLMGKSEAAQSENVDISKETGLSDEALDVVIRHAETINEIARLFPDYIDGLLIFSGLFLSGNAFNPDYKPMFVSPENWLHTIGALDFVLDQITGEWPRLMQGAGYAGLTTAEKERIIHVYQTYASENKELYDLQNLLRGDMLDRSQPILRALKLMRDLTKSEYDRK